MRCHKNFDLLFFSGVSVMVLPLPRTRPCEEVMTIDDDSSIYIGGLPYNITEETLRKAFGAILAVKIVNDRASGGKCIGFVTFVDPRSAAQAIKEMDGKVELSNDKFEIQCFDFRICKPR